MSGRHYARGENGPLVRFRVGALPMPTKRAPSRSTATPRAARGIVA